MNETQGRLIDSLTDGESGYTTPWAVYSAHQGALLLIRLDYHVKPISSGTSELKVTRRGNLFYVDGRHEGFSNGSPHPNWPVGRVLIK